MSWQIQRRMFIDEQAELDLACGALAEQALPGRFVERMRRALARAVAFWPEVVRADDRVPPAHRQSGWPAL